MATPPPKPVEPIFSRVAEAGDDRLRRQAGHAARGRGGELLEQRLLVGGRQIARRSRRPSGCRKDAHSSDGGSPLGNGRASAAASARPSRSCRRRAVDHVEGAGRLLRTERWCPRSSSITASDTAPSDVDLRSATTGGLSTGSCLGGGAKTYSRHRPRRGGPGVAVLQPAHVAAQLLLDLLGGGSKAAGRQRPRSVAFSTTPCGT